MHTSSHALARLLGDWSSGPGPAHRRLADLTRLLILDGRLPLATTMPGERDLAAVLGISRTTVSTAYATLREQGYLSARARSRSRARVPPGSGTGQPAAGAIGHDLIDFSYAAPPAPGEALHRAYRRALDQLPRHLPRHGYCPIGLAELRTAIARRYADRGLTTTPDQILVTNGAQHALALVARTLLRPRGRVVVDHPTYPHALQVFRAAGCRTVPVAVTDSGWDLESLSAATRGAALAYLLPELAPPPAVPVRTGPGTAAPRLSSGGRRDDGRARPGRRSASSPRCVSPGRHHDRLGGQDLLGWPAGGMGPRGCRPRPATGTGTRRHGPRDAGAGTARLRRAVGRNRPDPARPAGRPPPAPRPVADSGGRAPDRLDHRRVDGWPVGVGPTSPPDQLGALAAVAPQFGVRLAAGPRFGVGGAFERFVRLPYSLDAAAMTAGIDGIAEALAAVRAGRRADTPPAALA